MSNDEKIEEKIKLNVMEEAFKKVLRYLKWLNKDIESISEEDLLIVVKEPIPETSLTIKILIKIFNDKWLRMFGVILDGESVKKFLDAGCNVYEEILKLSFNAAEFSFAVDEDKNIYIKQDIHLAALTFDVFDEEYHAIPRAIKVFGEELFPKLKKCLELK